MVPCKSAAAVVPTAMVQVLHVFLWWVSRLLLDRMPEQWACRRLCSIWAGSVGPAEVVAPCAKQKDTVGLKGQMCRKPPEIMVVG